IHKAGLTTHNLYTSCPTDIVISKSIVFRQSKLMLYYNEDQEIFFKISPYSSGNQIKSSYQ
ncbi:MAG: hypothetical protein M3230_02945, partial [Thermoproteota archaeon]|nr:hypothetical protein [Thermoproteota archaeon]